MTKAEFIAWIVSIVGAVGLVYSIALAKPMRLDVKYRLNTDQVVLIIQVPPNQDNRLLRISWDLEGGAAGEESIQLDGVSDREYYFKEYPFRLDMHYIFVVSLHDARGKLAGRATIEIGE